MISLAELEQYFPSPNESIICKDFAFKISLSYDEETFVVNLKIKQKDTKEKNLIKFRLGLGKDKETESEVHDTKKTHFEIDFYKRSYDAFSATVYFTLIDTEESKLFEYAKGTVSIISKIIAKFFETHELDLQDIQKIIYERAVHDELRQFEPSLIKALYQCYQKSQLVLRDGNESFVIKTEHNLKKYLGQKYLEPLFLPLLEKIQKS